MASSVVIQPLSKLTQDFINKDYQRIIRNRKRKVDEENEVAGASKRSCFDYNEGDLAELDSLRKPPSRSRKPEFGNL